MLSGFFNAIFFKFIYLIELNNQFLICRLIHKIGKLYDLQKIYCQLLNYSLWAVKLLIE